MARTRYNKQPGGSSFYRKLASGGPESQAAVVVGGRPVRQTKLDKWQAGTDKIEAAMIPWRSKRHRFHQLGTLPACGRCGMNRDHRHNGVLIH